jgi:hypothetical protein
MFHNPLPRFDVPSYSLHVDRGAHVTFYSDAIARQLVILAPNTNDTPGALKSPWQKVTASQAHHPPHYEGASSEVWHAEVDTLDIHFAGESEKCESMEHYEKSLAFWSQF